MIASSRYRQLTPLLKTLDLAQTVAFYVDILGFQVTVLHPTHAPDFCILTRDDTELSFYQDSREAEKTPQLTGQLYFDVADVTALYTTLKDRLTIIWGLEVYSYGRREFAIKDCNGYILAFSEPTTDPPTCD
jgi:catechol 2,3-dioxygenase-like lactoylglutathione lyase family enzyme